MQERTHVEKHPKQDEAFRPAFETEATLARVDGNRELLRPMVALFAMQWSYLTDEIATAIRRRDGAALELAGHRLKVSLASFGAREASRVAQELEVRGRTGDFHDLETTCAGLKTAVDCLVNGLKEFARETAP